MAHEAALQQALSKWPGPVWERTCIHALIAAGSRFKHGLVDKYGAHMSNLTEETWGVDIETCYRFCGVDTIVIPVFSYESFSACLTNYYLPFLALTAQLPFQTGGHFSDIMAFGMAVGSPALVTYSLTITISNRASVRRKFSTLLKEAMLFDEQNADRSPGYVTRIKAALVILQEGQQVPLRASDVDGWFSSLITSSKNKEWWEQVKTNLQATRRGVTASLVAQTALAAAAYMLTIIAAFNTELGDPTSALQIAAGSLWLWLIPVVWGWIFVGVQCRANSVDNALETIKAYHTASPAIPMSQQGLSAKTSLNPIKCTDATDIDEAARERRLDIHRWYGYVVEGDEQQKGPIFNYARVFTWWQLVNYMEDMLRHNLVNIPRKERSNSLALQATRNDSPMTKPEEPSPSQVEDAQRSINSAQLAYPTWGRIDSDMRRPMWVGSFAAMVVQWGTTGASLLIAYRTPTRGLSCRSGSYLIYGVLGTVSWLCLFASMLVSHEIMLRYQAVHEANPSIDLSHREDPMNTYARNKAHAWLCAAAVGLRRLGKFVAGVNAVWLIVSSLLEFIGLYDNCWCSGVKLGLGNRGWIVLFKNEENLRNSALAPWIGGLAMTLIVCTVICICFNLGCRKKSDG